MFLKAVADSRKTRSTFDAAKTIALFFMAFILSTSAPAQENKKSAKTKTSTTAPALETDPLFNMSLDDLQTLTVSSVFRKEVSLFETPAAVSIITADDIAQSGLTTIPEILRLAPGIQVSRVEGNKWSIGIRGFGDRFNPNSLVLIDGRSVYTPLFSGVYWSAQDTFLQDIDSIEVVRGSGGSLWGSNAVNGIISITTKSAEHTQGNLIYGTIGDEDLRHAAGLRHGGKFADGYFRVYGKLHKNDAGVVLDANESPNNNLLPVGSQANDDWRRYQFGFRYDRSIGVTDSFTLQSDRYRGILDQTRISGGAALGDQIQIDGFNFITRLNKSLKYDIHSQWQFYFDSSGREDATLAEQRRTSDIDVSFSKLFDTRFVQEWQWGFGYRRSRDITSSGSIFVFKPETFTGTTYSAFIQNDIELKEKRIWLTLGSKLERNNISSSEYQPSAKIRYIINKKHMVWGTASRAVRTPSRADVHAGLQFGPTFVPIGNESLRSSTLYAYDLGYRWYPKSNLSIDSNIFYHNYRHLIDGSTNINHIGLYGSETSGTWQINDRWQVKTHYTFHLPKGPADYSVMSRTPKHLAYLRNSLKISKHWHASLSLYHYGKIYRDTKEATDAFVRSDIRLAWEKDATLLEIVGQNLTDSIHNEGFSSQRLNTGMERSFYIRATQTF